MVGGAHEPPRPPPKMEAKLGLKRLEAQVGLHLGGGLGGQEAPIDIFSTPKMSGRSHGRAKLTRSLWNPLIDNFQRNQSPDNKAKTEHPNTPTRRSAVADT